MNSYKEMNRTKTESIFDSKVYLVISVGIVYCLSLFTNVQISAIMTVLFALFGCTINKFLPLSIWISLYYLEVTMPGTWQIILWIICFFPMITKLIRLRDFLIILSSAALFFISYWLGYNPDLTSLIMQVFAIVTYLMVLSRLQNMENASLILSSFMLGGVLVLINVVFQIATNPSFLTMQRLTYNDSVRTLANLLTIPIYLLAYLIISNSSYFRRHRIFVLFSLFVFSAVLLLTYSRGNILALIVVLAFVSVKIMAKQSLKKSFFVLFGFLGFAAIIILTININTTFLFGTDTALGRFDIWKFYFSKLFEGGPIRVLFGFGPGDVRRVAGSSFFSRYYAHSSIFDYGFSYGFIGLAFILGLIVFSFKQLKGKNSFFNVGLLILTVLMFLPYGSCQHLGLHVLLALAATSLVVIEGDNNDI